MSQHLWDHIYTVSQNPDLVSFYSSLPTGLKSIGKIIKFTSKTSKREFGTVDITLSLLLNLLFCIVQCVKLKKNFGSYRRRNLKLLGGQAVTLSCKKHEKPKFQHIVLWISCLLAYFLSSSRELYMFHKSNI